MRSKRAIYNIITSLLLQLVIIINGFVVPKIIISSYGSSVNGLIASIGQFLSYIALLDSGFTAVVKSELYKPIAEKNISKINNILKSADLFFKKIAFIYIIYIIVLIFTYPLIVNNTFDYIFTMTLIVILSLSSLAEYYFGMTYRVFLQADQKSYVVSIIQIILYIINIILIIFLSSLNVSVQLLKLSSILIFTMRPIIQTIYVKKKSNVNIKLGDKKYIIKNRWDGMAQHIASVIHTNTDIAILTIMCSLVEVSIYSVYNLVVMGIKNLIQSFTGGIDATFGDMIAKNEYDNLNAKFNTYEIIFYSIITILFTSTIILIVPFVSVYTKEISDANYVRYAFGYLLVISEYIWAIRLPYSSITLAAGRFKQTKKGAWVECLTNIIISIILVRKYGLIGVTIGTIIAMLIRTLEFIYYSNKYILSRNIWKSLKKILVVVMETIVIFFICRYLPCLDSINYLNWLLNAIMVFLTSCIITLTINFICYRNEYKNVYKMIKQVFRRKNVS